CYRRRPLLRAAPKAFKDQPFVLFPVGFAAPLLFVAILKELPERSDCGQIALLPLGFNRHPARIPKPGA
ncbi:MAG TPA: hypothetical protein VI958_02160, partial [Acidobacteriota bacterium]